MCTQELSLMNARVVVPDSHRWGVSANTWRLLVQLVICHSHKLCLLLSVDGWNRTCMRVKINHTKVCLIILFFLLGFILLWWWVLLIFLGTSFLSCSWLILIAENTWSPPTTVTSLVLEWGESPVNSEGKAYKSYVLLTVFCRSRITYSWATQVMKWHYLLWRCWLKVQ